MEVRNSSEIAERIFQHKAKGLLHKLAADLSLKRPHVEFVIRTRGSGGDDPAKYISLTQIGPERGIFGMRKRHELVAVRSSDYSNHPHPIQIECFEADIEAKSISGFEGLGQTENRNSVYVQRYGYSI